ncbi:MAG: sodium ion-translocating decarboxylase subunit beta, partial [Arcobacter sp.]|nr:sodium ion-translocating decarboxylase subunit beta [Arcobacter sp.]
MKKNILIAIFLLFSAFALNSFASTPAVETPTEEKQPYHSKTMGELVDSFYATTGIKALFEPKVGVLDSHGKDMTLFAQGAGRIIMIFICF